MVVLLKGLGNDEHMSSRRIFTFNVGCCQRVLTTQSTGVISTSQLDRYKSGNQTFLTIAEAEGPSWRFWLMTPFNFSFTREELIRLSQFWVVMS